MFLGDAVQASIANAKSEFPDFFLTREREGVRRNEGRIGAERILSVKDKIVATFSLPCFIPFDSIQSFANPTRPFSLDFLERPEQRMKAQRLERLYSRF